MKSKKVTKSKVEADPEDESHVVQGDEFGFSPLACGTYREPEPELPDWDHWENIRRITITQAVFLILNIEPLGLREFSALYPHLKTPYSKALQIVTDAIKCRDEGMEVDPRDGTLSMGAVLLLPVSSGILGILQRDVILPEGVPSVGFGVGAQLQDALSALTCPAHTAAA